MRGYIYYWLHYWEIREKMKEEVKDKNDSRKVFWRNNRTGKVVEEGTEVTISEIDDWVKVETGE